VHAGLGSNLGRGFPYPVPPGLRFSEVVGLQWQDVDYTNHCIHVRRTWIDGKTSKRLKTKKSRPAAPMAAELAQFLREWHKVTVYGKPTDWVFASSRRRGRTPRAGNMLVSNHLRPAAIKARVNLKPGQRFGFHNLPAAFAQKFADHRAEGGRSHESGHSPS